MIVTKRHVVSAGWLWWFTVLTCCWRPLTFLRTTVVLTIVSVRSSILVLAILGVTILAQLTFVLLELEGESLDLVFQLLYRIGLVWSGDDGYRGLLRTILLWSREAWIWSISKRVEGVGPMVDCMAHEDADARLWAHTSNAHVLVKLL